MTAARWMAARTGSVVVPGGRSVGWVEHGPVDGVPVVCCHGAPGAPAEVAQFHGDELARHLGTGSRLTLVDDGHLSTMTNHATAVCERACGGPWHSQLPSPNQSILPR